MNIGSRIKKIRRHFDLTQQEFAARIGTVQNVITRYENDQRNPSSAVIALICREFNVSEEWLRTGKGDMLLPAPSAALDSLSEDYKLTHEEYILIEKFVKLKPEIRKIFVDYALDVAATINNYQLTPKPEPTYQGMTVEEAEAEYIKSRLNAAKKTTSSASSITEKNDQKNMSDKVVNE